MKSVLVVEDEIHLAEGLRFNLEAEGFDVHVEGDGDRALEWLLSQSANVDAVLLDVMLPGKDGFAIASALRAEKNFVPILLLTARGRPEDVLAGFAAGADDYLAKPFDLSILLARLNGLLRRSHWREQTAGTATGEDHSADVFLFNGREINFEAHELTAQGRVIRLTLMESELLRHLVRNADRAVSRKEILEQVWRVHEDTDTRAIDNFIVRLRRYIEDNPSQPHHLITVRGVGYRFEPNPVP